MEEKMNLRKIGVVLLALLLAAMAMVPFVNAADEQIINGNNFPLSQLKPDDSQTKVVIQNGFSLIKGDVQTVIPVGSIIQHSDNGITRVFDPNGKQISISNDIDSPKIPTPYGYLPAVNVNQIPDGSYVDVKDNGITNVYSKDQRVLTVISPVSNKTVSKKNPIPTTSGWIEDSYAWNIPQMGQFIADWTVPSSPPNPQTGAIDFIFNGIEPGNSWGIVQPVLEYNYAGTHQWTGSPWYVDSNNIGYRGTSIGTTVGHHVRGTLGWNQNLNRWNIIFEDMTNSGYSSSFSTNAPNIGTNNVGAFCALEGYYVNNDNDVPGTTTFYNMKFKDVNLNPVSFSWNRYVNTGMGLTNLNVAWSGMTPVSLWTNN
jgi:hypothetical protein